MQGKLLIGPKDDPLEREAEQVADRVTQGTAPGTESLFEPERAAGGSHGRHSADLPRAFNLAGVRIHADEHSAKLASAVSARALTIGSDIYLGKGETPSDVRLMAHELVHVDQQRELGLRLQRQALPQDDLMSHLRLNSMPDVELQDRYDQICAMLRNVKQSSNENLQLVEESREIGAILALRSGRTFAPGDVDKMRSFFESNAKSASPLSCIATLNKGVRTLLTEPQQKVAGSVEGTAHKLQATSHAGEAREIGFNDARGRPTSGTLSPVHLRESAWEAVVAMAGGDRGWSEFVMSLMDGYHSVTLSLDNSDPAQPKLYWSDQWSNKGGFKQYDQAGFDAEIEHLTHSWWEEEAAGTGESAEKTHRAVRMNTLVRIYRLMGAPHHVGPAPQWSPDFQAVPLLMR